MDGVTLGLVVAFFFASFFLLNWLDKLRNL